MRSTGVAAASWDRARGAASFAGEWPAERPAVDRPGETEARRGRPLLCGATDELRLSGEGD